MSSAICQNFVQNAWKKELCSNCFKSKDEHAAKPKPRPITIDTNKKVSSIIKSTRKTEVKRTVRFHKELTEVIGVGGEDWLSDDEDYVADEENDSGDTSEEDATGEPEEDGAAKELRRLTKENTDFNMTSLADVIEVKKSYTQLLLGKPLVDAEGKKQTLLVSVTPFGEDTNNPPPVKKFCKNLSHIPISKTNKEMLAETKTNVVLTSYTTKNTEEKTTKEEKSLLDEISETLEKSKNPIQIISRKKTQKEIVLCVTKTDSNKENISEVASGIEEPKSKCNFPEKRVSLTRTPALKRDQEKPVVYQTSTAKIELLNSKNIKLNKEVANNNTKAKAEVNNNNSNKTDDKIEGKTEDKPIEAIEATKASPTTAESVLKSKIVTENFIKAEVVCAESTMVEAKRPGEDLKPVEKPLERVMGLPPPVPKYNSFPQSREQAGEPDGRADPPEVASELPALPLTPPPILENQTSFLHGNPPMPIYEKPKVPSKPATVLIRKPANPNQNHNTMPAQTLTTFGTSEVKPELPAKANLSKQDSNDSDFTRAGNKRRAPKPPEDNQAIYSRNSVGPLESPPVVREKDKRASSCTPKMYVVNTKEYSTPEPAPRKSLSISTDSLACPEERRKEKQKGRFSLKKFLRMGSSKDLPKLPAEPIKLEENPEAPPLPKPRLVIVHPTELNGSKVEVVTKPHNADQPSDIYHSPKPTKPPPPPRNYDECHRTARPTLPHPPKSMEILNKQRQISRNNSATKPTETVYANIGEVRSALVPNKPQRTASMREREAQQLRKNSEGYEVILPNGKEPTENLYDYINSARSSSPESDSSRGKNSPKSKAARLNKRSESSIDVSGDYFKYNNNNNIPRSMSLTYCGSETESEIYSPYSFYGSESEVTEDDHDWIQNGRTQKLRSRKGRSIVHKNLEDNYGAVVVANHEALAQVLENIQQTIHILPALRGLKTCINLRWTDFAMKSGTRPVVVGRRAFHQALWGAQHVTLVVNAGVATSSTLSLGTFALTPVTEFSDLIPNNYLPRHEDGEDQKHIQATVAVLPWLQVNTIQSFSETLRSKTTAQTEDTWKDACFVMLQLVNALKTLQAQGIEELPLSLNSFILCKEMDRETHHRLCVLQGLGCEPSKNDDEKYGTLCMCALKALVTLQPSLKTTPLIQSLLNNERAVSLTQVKSILEFSLWGPSDVALGSTIRERELALQRWLDLQRATVLHGLVCTRIQLTVYEECHLLFLVRSNARMMCDASLLIESSNIKHNLTNGHK